jgi:hypothetical protein
MRILRIWIGILAAVPLAAQTYAVSGTVVTADSQKPIAAAAVIAVRKATSTSQPPVIRKALTDASGHYTFSAPAGQYQLCIHNAGLYLDPCRWGGSVSVTMTSAAVAAPAVQLTKGGRFILRAHDQNSALPMAETALGDALTVTFTDATGKAFALPISYQDPHFRDYGDIMPIGLTMSVKVSSTKVQLSDIHGAVPNLQGIPFQVADLTTTAKGFPGFGGFFPHPNATVVHIYINGH